MNTGIIHYKSCKININAHEYVYKKQKKPIQESSNAMCISPGLSVNLCSDVQHLNSE